MMTWQLDLVDLDQELPGQRRFISCWVGQYPGFNFLVDPGPPATADFLIGRLEDLGIDHLDHIFLTHIHLDHGGATARILDRWPAARVHCHPAGHKHLAAPKRLWEGSRQVLGHKATVYGEPGPVPAEAIVPDGGPVPPGVTIIPTPGHAPHHLAFLLDGHLFLGEAAGTFSTLGKGAEARDYYLRPATPPRFFLPIAAASLDRLLALEPVPRTLCFAHHGRHCGDSTALLTRAKEQLFLWADCLRGYLQENFQGAVPAAGPDQEAIFPDLVQALRQADPYFARGADLPEDIRIREEDFTRQTLRGMLGYLSEATGR